MVQKIGSNACNIQESSFILTIIYEMQRIILYKGFRFRGISVEIDKKQEIHIIDPSNVI